jgi:hypothetical protein
MTWHGIASAVCAEKREYPRALVFIQHGKCADRRCIQIFLDVGMIHGSSVPAIITTLAPMGDAIFKNRMNVHHRAVHEIATDFI